MSNSSIELGKNNLTQVLKAKIDLKSNNIDKLLPFILESVTHGLKKEIDQENKAGVFNLLTNDYISYSNPIISNIGSQLIRDLVNNFKIDDSTARTISIIAIPYVINEISKKLHLNGDPDGNLSSLIGVLGEHDEYNRINYSVENSSKEIGGLSYLLSRR